MFDELAIGLADRRRRLKARSWLALRLGGLLLTLALAGCEPNVLDPQGEVGRSAATILVNSVAIMLAIVIPTIVAIVGFAWWFRAGNAKPAYRPDFEYSGQLELVVWSIPTLTVLLLSGVIWIGSHRLDPASADRRRGRAADHSGRLARLEMAVSLSRPEVASINELVLPVAASAELELTSGSVMTAFFVPRWGSMIYVMNGMTSHLDLRADGPANSGLASHLQRRRLLGYAVQSPRRFARGFQRNGRRTRLLRRPPFDAAAYTELQKQSARRPAPSACRPASVRRYREPEAAAQPRANAVVDLDFANRWWIDMLGKLTWDAIPFDHLSRSSPGSSPWGCWRC